MLLNFACRRLDDIFVCNATSIFSALSSAVCIHFCEALSMTRSLDRCKRVLYLNELCLRPFVIVQQPLLILAIRHQNDAPFHHLYRHLMSGIKPRRAQPLAGKNNIRRGFVENIRAVSHN